jgi:hypothetical protein
VTIIGGGTCTHNLTASGSLQLTEASIAAHPSNGTLTQTGTLNFKYQPEAGFKGSDEYSIEVCGHDRSGSGCSTLTYEVTVE